MDRREILKAIEAKTRECVSLAEAHYGRTFEVGPVELSTRMTTAAGKVNRCTMGTRYSLPIIQRNPLDAFLAQTVPHEVAHVVCLQVYPDARGHGREWQRIMRVVMGRPAARCHRYTSGAEHSYRCGCEGREVYLSTVRHNRVRRGTAYSCRLCGEILIPVEPRAALRADLAAVEVALAAQDRKPHGFRNPGVGEDYAALLEGAASLAQILLSRAAMVGAGQQATLGLEEPPEGALLG